MDMKVGIRVVAAGVFSRRPSLGVPREVVPRTMLDAAAASLRRARCEGGPNGIAEFCTDSARLQLCLRFFGCLTGALPTRRCVVAQRG